MKRILRSAGVLLVISALFTPAAQGYLTVAGNGTAPATANGTTFVIAPNQAVFFRPTGEYYFGLGVGATLSYALSVGKYRSADTAPVLTPLGEDAAFSSLNINNLAIVPNSNDATSPTIVATVGVAGAAGTGVLNAISKTVLTPDVTAALGDTTPAATGSVRGLTASRSSVAGADVVFAAVKETAAVAADPFGAGAGAVVGTDTDGINAALITQTAGNPVFTYVGANGVNTARAVDCLNAGAYAVAAADAPVTEMEGANPAFCYDEQLGCIYVGIQGNSARGANALSAIIGVGIYPVTIIPGVSVAVGAAAAATPVAALGTDTIIGAVSGNALNNAYTNILKLRTMHTSTGMAYLIVNGNSTTAVPAGTSTANQALQVANQVWAVPLVNSGADIGTFANVNSGGHVLKAAIANDLVTTTSNAAQVGGSVGAGAFSGTAPISTGGAGANLDCIADMYVDGDAVYVATSDTTVANVPSGNSEPGLWKSQAIFNDLGQIDHWTDWQKVVPSDMGGDSGVPGTAETGTDGSVDFAAVDSYTGHIWAINNTSLKAKVTKWTQPTGAATSQELLASAVNSALGTACYSVLDLNISVTGWGAATPTQIALFGGQEKVCFAITGTRGTTAATIGGTYTSINYSMDNDQYDYSSTSTFITTSLPAGAGAVVSLGFSGWDATAAELTPGFFLAGCAGTAGTPPALYAYTPAGAAGFNPTTVASGTGLSAGQGTFPDLGLLPIAPAAAALGSWQKVDNVSGMPIKIQGFGGGLHVLTRSATIDRIYSCPRSNTLALLNSSFVVTASTGNTPTAGSTDSDLASVKQIYDFVVSVSAQAAIGGLPTAGVEQLTMLTNDGIYTTSSLTGMQAPTSQLNAGWVLIDGTSSVVTQGYFSNYIGLPAYNRLPQTFWLANYAVNPAIASVYNKNIQYQVARESFEVGGATLTNALSYTANPTPTATFNGALSFGQTTAPTVYANFPVLYRLFYNDGARRFFIQKNPNDDTKYQVLVLPYNLYDYNITTNGKAPLSDAVVAQAGAFYWMSPIGDTGRLMMGTSNGVISLQ